MFKTLNMEKLHKFCEKYEMVGYIISYPFLLSVLELMLGGTASKFNLCMLMTPWFGLGLTIFISFFFCAIALGNFFGLMWRFYNYLK
jgi:hypothetical protein|tara:strand:+ start:246 stop:506 length:261 start_codon:yes stop_codon:yes gene_type:complete